MDPMIDNTIAKIGGVSQALSKPPTKEVVADTACNIAWVNWNLRHVIRTGRDGSTLYETGMDVKSKPFPFPIPIESPTIDSSCGINRSLQVGKKQQSSSPDKVSNSQKLDTVINRKFTDDQDYTSLLIKLIVHKLSNGSIYDLYLRCRMNFSSNAVQTKAPQFVDLGLPAINTSNKLSVLGTTATRTIIRTDVYHWLVPDHVF